MEWLLDTSDFTPRWQCGHWPLWLGYAGIFGNLLIACSYFIIPFFLFRFWRLRRDMLSKPSILLWFVAFIVLCGATHVTDAAAFYWPAYRFFVILRTATAAVSLVTACLLPAVISRLLLLMRSSTEYQLAIDLMKSAIERNVVILDERDKLNATLTTEVIAMQGKIRELELGANLVDQCAAMREHLQKLGTLKTGSKGE